MGLGQSPDATPTPNSSLYWPLTHTSTRHKGELHLIYVHHLVDGGIKHPFQQLYDWSTGIIPLLKTASASFLMSLTPSSPTAFSILAMPGGPAALPHFILLSALPIWIADTGRMADSWGNLRELIAWPFELNIGEPSILLYPDLHALFISECKPSASLSTQFSPITSCFVRSICLAIWKTTAPSGDTVANSSCSASDFVSQVVCFAMCLVSF